MHTPGPWISRQVFANRWNIEASPNGDEFVPICIAHVSTTVLEVGVSNNDTEANALLIAAAPRHEDGT